MERRVSLSQIPAHVFQLPRYQLAMSTAKAQLYGSSLDLARRLDLFASKHPADHHGKVHRGTGDAADGLDWKELLRKFTKHNPQREGTPAFPSRAFLRTLRVHEGVRRLRRRLLCGTDLPPVRTMGPGVDQTSD